jgi:hypothetical protein
MHVPVPLRAHTVSFRTLPTSGDERADDTASETPEVMNWAALVDPPDGTTTSSGDNA